MGCCSGALLGLGRPGRVCRNTAPALQVCQSLRKQIMSMQCQLTVDQDEFFDFCIHGSITGNGKAERCHPEIVISVCIQFKGIDRQISRLTQILRWIFTVLLDIVHFTINSEPFIYLSAPHFRTRGYGWCKCHMAATPPPILLRADLVCGSEYHRICFPCTQICRRGDDHGSIASPWLILLRGPTYIIRSPVHHSLPRLGSPCVVPLSNQKNGGKVLSSMASDTYI